MPYMDEPYLPAVDFLIMAANEEIPFTGSKLAEENLRLLISFTTDADLTNRDWATMLLAGQDIDTQEVRNALIAAADDIDACVRGEAIQGLAQRNRELALPMIERELQRDECGYATFQAARELAHQNLIKGLHHWQGRGGAPWIDDEISEAIAACEAALGDEA